MPSPRYGTPYWLHRFPKSRRPVYPRHRGHLDVDVAIVGGGLTGAMTAYGFAAGGVKVAVLEADRVGQGSTAGSPGLVLTELQTEFRDLVARYGLRAARRIAQMMRRAALDASATLRRLRIRCDLTPADALHVAVGPEAARALRREVDAQREAGLEAVWQTAAAIKREAHLDAAAGGLRVRGNARFDPYRAALGLMAAAAGRGALVFENTRVERVRPGRKAVDIRTNSGTLRCASVIVATGSPTADLKPLRRHFQQAASYCALTAPLPASVRRAVVPSSLVLRDSWTPPHYVRWVGDDRLLVSGADQPQSGARGRDRILVQRTGQLMYELSLLYPAVSGIPAEYGWDFEIARPVDGIPCLGPHRNYPRYLFALGTGHNGAGVAWLASRILLRHYSGASAKGDELFAFARLLGR